MEEAGFRKRRQDNFLKREEVMVIVLRCESLSDES